MKTFNFADVPQFAFDRLIEQVKGHGVEFFASRSGNEILGTFRSDAGAGSFAYDGQRLSVTIIHDRGDFPSLMITGGLRQLVQEAVERV